MDPIMDVEEEWSLDCLPFDSIVCICEFLTPEDLSRFARVCKVDLQASKSISIFS